MRLSSVRTGFEDFFAPLSATSGFLECVKTGDGVFSPLQRRESLEKVLCVDDDPSLLCLYQEELSEEGYKVVLAKDGKEGLAKFEKEKPNVVVMDIRMPIMNGIEALTSMLGKDRQVPVILKTAYPQYKENFMTWGAEAYVIKSSDLNELKQKIREVLDKRKKSKPS